MCGAKSGGVSTEGLVLGEGQSVVQGTVTRQGEPVAGAYVRLLDRSGEFTAEVPTSATGQFRFFAVPGTWTVRTLAPRSAVVERPVVASSGAVTEVDISLG